MCQVRRRDLHGIKEHLNWVSTTHGVLAVVESRCVIQICVVGLLRLICLHNLSQGGDLLGF